MLSTNFSESLFARSSSSEVDVTLVKVLTNWMNACQIIKLAWYAGGKAN